jgi:tetratricopeptide (TPR) repeat protein
MMFFDMRRVLFVRRAAPALLLGLLLLPPPLVALVPSGSNQQPALLHPHQAAFFHLPAAGTLALELDARTGDGAEILIETSAPREEFVVLAPNRQPLVTVTAEQPGWLIVSFLVGNSGRYRLEARQEAAQDRNGGISLRVDLLPFASARLGAHVRAATLFAGAESLARSPDSAPLLRAVELYRRAGAIWAAEGDREGQILAFAAEARTWLNLSEYSNAIAALKQSQFLSLQNPFFSAWLSNIEAEVYLDRWDSERALHFAQEAMRLSRGLSDDWLTADSLAGRGEAEYLTGDPGRQQDIEDALLLSRDSNLGGTLARALRCKAWMEGDEGRVSHARAFMGQAEEEFRAVGQTRNAVDAMANLATIQGMEGNRYAALTRHSSLMPLIRASGKRADLAFLLVNVGNDYMALNRVPDAVAYYRQAIETFGKIGLLSGESVGVSQLCIAETRAGHLHEAMRDCSRAMAVAEQLHDPKRLAITIWRLGTVQRVLGRKEQAIASFRRAYGISERVHDPRSEAQSLMDWGDVVESSGLREEARLLFERSLPLSREAEDAPEQLEARYHIAHVEFEAGEDEDAERDLKTSLDSVAAQRLAVGNPDLQASYFAQVRKCHELMIELLMRRQQRDPSSGAAVQALEISESGRALSLLDAVAAHDHASARAKPGRQSQDLLELQIAVERAYDQRLKIMLEGGHKRDLDANEAILTQAIDALERAEDVRNGTDSTLPAARPLSAAEIIAASQSLGVTLVEYELGSEHSYVWVIDGGIVESHTLPGRASIEFGVRVWRALATARIARRGERFDEHRSRLHAADKDLPRIADDLSCTLLGTFLKPGMEHLAIVPDGDLDLLSFAALPEKGCNGEGQPLMVSHQVVLTPSLSILLTPHEPAHRASFRGEVALFADPVFDRGDPRVDSLTGSQAHNDMSEFGVALPRLFGTREEAKAIAAVAGPERSALYLDFDASLQTLLNTSLGEYRILHLATHGLLDESAPGFSGLVLSLVNREGQPVFGYLKRHDIERLSLRSDLVVLSSCDSAEGPNLSGEGVIGLNHAFLSAGARRVLSTIWSVDDDTSKDLIIDFYRGMLLNGLDAAEALRRSQMKIMRNAATSAPYYWAGFTITTAVM